MEALEGEMERVWKRIELADEKKAAVKNELGNVVGQLLNKQPDKEEHDRLLRSETTLQQQLVALEQQLVPMHQQLAALHQEKNLLLEASNRGRPVDINCRDQAAGELRRECNKHVDELVAQDMGPNGPPGARLGKASKNKHV